MATIKELAKWGIIESVQNMGCPLYFMEDDDVDHLFGYCYSSNFLWKKLYDLISVDSLSNEGPLSVRLQNLYSSIFF